MQTKMESLILTSFSACGTEMYFKIILKLKKHQTSIFRFFLFRIKNFSS